MRGEGRERGEGRQTAVFDFNFIHIELSKGKKEERGGREAAPNFTKFFITSKKGGKKTPEDPTAANQAREIVPLPSSPPFLDCRLNSFDGDGLGGESAEKNRALAFP